MKNILDSIKKFIVNKIPWSAIWEGAKEAFRVAAIAVLPILYAGLNTTTGEINLNWKLIAVVFVVSVLKCIDKTLHEIGKTFDVQSLIKGLTRF